MSDFVKPEQTEKRYYDKDCVCNHSSCMQSQTFLNFLFSHAKSPLSLIVSGQFKYNNT